LTDTWQTQIVLWEQLQQGGWGTQARFDPKHVLNLNLAADAKDMPIELWVDDVEFITAEQAARPQPQPTTETPTPAKE
jgi:hypothetical protein